MNYDPSPLPGSEPPGRSGLALLIGVIVICTGVEGTLWLADHGVIGIVRLRRIAYDYGGFWPGLLREWTPNYAGQPYVMFLTYGFLHGGMAHLVANMITLWSLGRAVIARVGRWGFVLLYGISILGGGAGFGLLASGLNPMVGASGALFGLAGGLLAWMYVDKFHLREGLWSVAQIALGLFVLNVVLWWTMDGQLAWETHLAGFVVGWIVALLIDPRARTPQSE